MVNKQYEDWLAGLNIGSVVVVSTDRFGHTTYMISEVVKITPKRRMRVKGYTNILFKHGQVFASHDLLEPTDELINTINLSHMRGYLDCVEWDTVNDAIVTQIRELLR